MKITTQILSLPPYISTTWGNVASLQVLNNETGPVLIVELVQGGRVAVPGLSLDLIHKIFAIHSNALEISSQVPSAPKGDLKSLALNLPIKMFGDSLEKMESLLQHNPDQADAEELPPEVVEKIGVFIQTLGLSDTTAVPNAEDGCNCTFCQIARAIHGALETEKQEATLISSEDPVSEDDLRFRSWDINQKGDKLYQVTNPLDQNEHYNVFLGEPIGCTCGMRNCEHVRAVLSS